MEKDDRIIGDLNNTRTKALWKRPRGIDISSVQVVTDWRKIRDNAGIDFVIVKCTDGTKGVDPSFEKHLAGVLDAGKIPGVYHVCHPRPAPGMSILQDAEAEVANLYARAGKIGDEAGELSPSLDFELNEIAVDQQAVWLKHAIKCIHDSWKRPPIIYSGGFMSSTLQLVPGITDLFLWVAHYTNTLHHKDNDGKRFYNPPASWEKVEARAAAPTIQPWSRSVIWQHAGGGNDANQYLPGFNVDGIVGWVDQNAVFATPEEWARMTGEAA